MNPAEVAYRAAEIISERVHCKSALQDDQGRVCFIGALNVAISGEADHVLSAAGKIAYGTARDILREDGYLSCPVMYNNDYRTTGEDVILLLKRTGERLDAGIQR